jgi:hypothetical protein
VIECDAPQPNGTLTVQSNEAENPQYSYTLTCVDITEATPTPTSPPPGDDGGNGDPGDTGDTPGLEEVTQLPQTGESPVWRDPLLLLLAVLVALGGFVGGRRLSRD